MGQCLSQSSETGAFGDVIKGSSHHESDKHAKRRFLPPKLVFEGRRASSASSDDAKNKKEQPKLTILTTTEALEATSVAQAPLTGKTAAETPASVMPSPLNTSIDAASDDASSHEAASSVEEGEEPLPSSRGGSGLSLVHFFQSLRHTQELDHVIPEEVDPDAPSDEEDERLLQEQALARKNPPSTRNTMPKSTAASPPRPQDRIKMQFSRSTRPDSIVSRNAIADSKVPGSVKNSHISEFRKLKLKVKLAAKQERKKARIAKLEDRYEDVRGYNSLWQDYQEIQGQTERATSDEPSKLKRSDSFDLHDTDSWFFDFQSFDEEDASAYDFDDDDASQSSLSLLSTASMESQRRYFQEKREGRTRRNHHSDMNLLLMNQIIHTKKPVDESTPMRPMYSPSHTKLGRPPSILRGKKNGNETTPVSRLGTPESRGPVAPKMNAFEMATGEPEYHCYRRPGEKPVDHDEDTPKAKSRRKNASYVEPTDVDTNNDYQVTRRRRAASANDADFAILPDERTAMANLGILLPPSPPKRDFEYSSFAIEVVTTDQPDIRVMRMSPNENTNRKEKIVSGNAAKCLEETANATSPLMKNKTRDVTGYRYEEPPVPTIASMSTQDFLMFSSDHALVNVSNKHSHEILLDSSSSLGGPSDKENEGAPTYDDVANDVTEQIDVLLEKYRHDNEESIIHPSTSGEVSDESIQQEQ